MHQECIGKEIHEVLVLRIMFSRKMIQQTLKSILEVPNSLIFILFCVLDSF
jgi:hypothetical protein